MALLDLLWLLFIINWIGQIDTKYSFDSQITHYALLHNLYESQGGVSIWKWFISNIIAKSFQLNVLIISMAQTATWFYCLINSYNSKEDQFDVAMLLLYGDVYQHIKW